MEASKGAVGGDVASRREAPLRADSDFLWFPIASSDDLPPRHTYRTKLLGQELAVWRADDGYVNVWQDRCLHRGLRLSLGLNDGAELKCQYHGWRYASRSAGCTYIPAHPGDAPSRNLCATTFPAVERHGLVWSREQPLGDVAHVPFHAFDPVGPSDGGSLVLRAIGVHAPFALVAERLRDYRFRPNPSSDGGRDGRDTVECTVECTVDSADERHVAITANDGAASARVSLFVQPLDEQSCIVRGLLGSRPSPDALIAVLRHHNALLSALSDQAEGESASLPPQTSPRPLARPTVARIVEVKPPTVTRAAPHRVVVARKWRAAEGIAGFELEPIDGHLPSFQPGAHVDVHLPNGLVRQYSLTNGPGDTARYRIGVKRELDSRGGSQFLHDTTAEGDVLSISAPHNNFPLRRDRSMTVLIAGGVGVTPLLAMALTLHRSPLDYRLHYFAQSAAHLGFPEVLDALGARVVPHLGLSPTATGQRLREVLTEQTSSSQLYVCGPGPMLESTRQIAADLGWPEDDVHFEYFKNTKVPDQSSSFEVELARSARTLRVPAGTTVLDALAGAGVTVPSSCQQGACGTCLVTVLDGEPDHQDVHLSEAQKRRNDCMLVCVSRSKSARLVLDV